MQLFAMPSTLSGFARTLDVGGTFNEFNRSSTPHAAATAAIAADWRSVGNDLTIAARRWAREQGISR